MRKTLFGLLVGLILGATAYSGAQDVSIGGAFLPLEDITVSGVWTFRGASPIKFEGGTDLLADDAFELTLAVPSVTADTTLTLPTFGSASAAFLFSTLATNDLDVANSIWGVSNGLQFEGATADGFETTVSPTNVGADITLTMPGLGNASGAFLATTLTTNDLGAANSVWGVSNGLTFEGATANAGELFLTVADIATASRTMTLPDMGAASAVLASTLTTNTVNVANAIWGVSNGLAFSGATGADGFEVTLTTADPGADFTATLQAATGTIALQTQATVTLTNVDLDTTDNSIAANVCEDQAAVTAAGVAAADQLLWVMTTTDLGPNFSISHMVPAAGSVTIRVCNETAGALDPGAVADFRLTSIK